jgi:hypothetical protein
VYLIGGYDADGPTYHNSVHVLNCASGSLQWRQLPSMFHKRCYIGAVLFQVGEMSGQPSRTSDIVYNLVYTYNAVYERNYLFHFFSIVKGIGSPHEYFFKVYKINQYLLSRRVLTGRIFKISKCFQGFIFHFLRNKAAKKLKTMGYSNNQNLEVKI